MKRNIIETVLGAIVLLVAIAFLAYGSSATDAGEVNGYTITARFNDVGALQKGDDVRIGPNAVVITDVPAGSRVFVDPPRMMQMRKPRTETLEETSRRA